MFRAIVPKPVWRPTSLHFLLGVSMWIILGLLALTVTACGGSGGMPRPLVAETRAVVVQSADSLEISLYFTVQGNIASIDSIGGSLEQPTGVVVKQLTIPAAQRNVLTFKRARPATAISGRVCAGPLYMKGGTQLAGSCLTWGYVPPSITTDSIRIAMDVRIFRPDGSLYASYRARPGQHVIDSTLTERLMTGAQFCTYIRFGRGRIIAKPNDTVTRCQDDFRVAYLALRT